jgi:DNA modification methylase
MPTIHWEGKGLTTPEPASLKTDSIIYPNGFGYPKNEPTGRLIQGDNLSIMAALLPDYEGCINLIYADPPFFTNRKFNARIGRGEDSRKPGEWKLAESYRDDWRDLDEYLDYLHKRLAMMYRLLSPNGTFYLHLDWHADAYARLILDDLFGADNFLNEIIWTYHGPSPIRSAFNRKHDTILSYIKGKDYTFNADAVREPYNENTFNTFKSSSKAGFGKVPDLERGKVPEDWWYFPVVARLHNERTGYPTQKPLALLERIILASSNPGDIVADFFCGSGTAPYAAAKYGRHFVASDENPRAIHTTRGRLIDFESVFTIERDTKIKFTHSKLPNSSKVNILEESISLHSELDLDYWEVDPNWDGKIFRSASQAKRPARSGNISSELKIKVGGKSCVGLVTAEGRHYRLDV